VDAGFPDHFRLFAPFPSERTAPCEALHGVAERTGAVSLPPVETTGGDETMRMTNRRKKAINRREFLTSTAGAFAAIAAGSVFGAAESARANVLLSDTPLRNFPNILDNAQETTVARKKATRKKASKKKATRKKATRKKASKKKATRKKATRKKVARKRDRNSNFGSFRRVMASPHLDDPWYGSDPWAPSRW